MESNPTKILMAVLLAGMALLAGGCGNSGQQAKTPESSIDPCGYLTSTDIENVLGWKVATTEPKAYGPTGTCTYKSATPYSAKGMQVLTVTIAKGMSDINTSEPWWPGASSSTKATRRWPDR